MIRFAPVDAALEGFRITRERPVAVLLWAVFVFAANVALQAWMLGSAPLQSFLTAYARTPPTSPEAMEAMLAKAQAAGPQLFVFAFAGAVVNVVLYTAVLRSVLEPSASRGGYLRVGREELRQLGLLLVITAAWVVYSTLINLLAALLGGVAAATPQPVSGLIRGLIFVAAVIAMVYPVVRLSLAPAMTFADRRLSVMRSWAMTEGQFWGLFGGYVLSAVLALLVALLAMLVLGAVAQVASLASNHAFDLGSVAKPQGAMTAEVLFSPASLVFLLIFWACYTLGFAIFGAFAPAAFRQLSGRAGAPAQEG